MALKDLIVQRSSLTEAAIEEIVGKYVNYDPEEKAVALTAAGSSLGLKAKVLVYLVALQGWKFVTDEDVPVDAKPAEITEHVGIPGGSLRPTLKELKDSQIIDEKGGRYFIRPVRLDVIKNALSSPGGVRSKGSKRGGTTSRAKPSSKGEGSVDKQSATNAVGETAAETKDRASSRSSTDVSGRFARFIRDGFFNKPKTLAELKEQFHKVGVILPRTSLPGLLLKAIRSEVLEREKAVLNGKEVWTYRVKA